MTGKAQLQKAFQQPYDRNNFVNNVIFSVFQKKNNVEIYDTPKNLTNELQPSYQKLIKKVAVYGQIGLDDGAKIVLYEIILRAGVRLENNKVSIQKYIRSIIVAGEGILVNFVREDKQKNWRLTLITSDTEITEKGIKTVHSNTKRYTYLLGENETCRTIAERFEEIEKSKDISLFAPKDKNTASVFNAFSVEKLSKTFFDEYKTHYERFCQHLQNSDQRKYIFNISFPDKATKDEKEKLSKPIRDFVKKTLGRIVFLYFVQKKGWLGATDTNYTNGNQHFIKDLFDNSGGDGNFYPLHLSKLFFEALNTPRPNDAYVIPQKSFMSAEITKQAVCVPFLNGGLFEKEAFEDKTIIFEPALFHNPTKSDDPKQRGFLDFLNAYNFTIYEDSADDHTVAVDPEMLGHIFENLLEDNKDKGAFYTPKEIVHYMCQESLLEYLNTKLQSSEQQKNELLLLIKYSEISEYITQKQAEINLFLDNVKICDPAIGSGAFPMGMLQEIFKIKILLNPNLDKAQAKKHIIQNAIYGVDIEKGAVDIARLRFWLSLIVDETKPQALPNLDYKIMQGNSLVSKFEGEIIDIDWEIRGNQNNDFKKQIRKNLDDFNQYKQQFFNTGKDKDKLKEKIRIAKIDLLKSILTYDKAKYVGDNEKMMAMFEPTPKERKEQAEIAIKLKGYTDALQKLEKAKLDPNKILDFFDWKLDFADVLNPAVNENTGFDIVVGNPPYINIEKIDQSIKDNISKFRTAYQKYDLYVLFYEAALTLLKEKGILSFITSNKFLSQGYGLKLRQEFLKYRIDQIVNFNYDVFESATVRSCIVQISKTTPTTTHSIDVIDVNTIKDKEKFTNRIVVNVPQKTFDETEENNFRINLTTEKITLLRKIENSTYQLYDICSVNYGLRPVSLIQGNDKFSFIKNEFKSGYKKYFEGKDTGKWLIDSHCYLDYKKEEIYNPMFEELFDNPKLAGLCTLSEINKLRFVYDADSCYCNHSLGILTLWHYLEKVENITIKRTISKEKIVLSKKYSYSYLQGILNSKIIKFYVNELMYDGTHFYLNQMKVLPIKTSEISKQESIAKIVLKIHLSKTENKDANTTDLEQEIDNLVYKLYELTYEEVKVIDPTFTLSEQEYESIKL